MTRPHHLRKIVSVVREELTGRKSAVPFRDVVSRAKGMPCARNIRDHLGGGPGIIAEIKRASPSRGWIRKDLDPALTARSYAAGGACAISVLTENRFFGGTLQDLAEAKKGGGGLPVLRKDFLLDEYMVAESRAHGADLVLLIVAVLGNRTPEMVRMVTEYGMEALVEVHNEEEMEVAGRSGTTVVGINNRDLTSLRVNLDTAARLLPQAPSGTIRVVESGISSRAEIMRFSALGADAFLVGESLVRSPDAAEAIRMLTEGVYNKDQEKERGEWKRRSP